MADRVARRSRASAARCSWRTRPPSSLMPSLPNERGRAMGISMVAGIAGLVHRPDRGRHCSPTSTGGWCSGSTCRSASSAPSGPTPKLRELGQQRRTTIDWWGNVTFAVGLIMILVGITYGLQPANGHNMGWTSPWVLFELLGGIALLVRLRLSSNCVCPSRCSTSSCSASAPSPRATPRHCCHRSGVAACSSC